MVFDGISDQITDAFSSEHTSYKSTKRYLSRLPYTEGPYVIQGPGENAGIVRLGKDWALAIRIESHNHPSFIHPWRGAATGVGGILRDIFTMGARPIALLDFLRFGTNEKATHIREEVVRGIADYGNTVGVPVVGGDIHFDKTYDNNCLVNVACLGLVKEKNIIYGRATTPGDCLIYVGGKTGRDGMGGAQMASQTLNVMDEAAVQNADPYLEKLLLEACCELAETGWIVGMQDMGAAGLLCSTTEVIKRGRDFTRSTSLGATILLDYVPTKASDMTPIELLLSESQERMLIVGKKEHIPDIFAVFNKWDLEAATIGHVTNDGFYTLRYQGSEWAAPFGELFPDVEENWPLTAWKTQNTNHLDTLPNMSKELLHQSIWRQYDHMVGTRTVKGPDTPGNCAVLNIPEIGKHLVITWASDEGGINQDRFRVAVAEMFVQALSKMIDLGAEPLGLTNCLNFGHPKDSMGAFAQTVEDLGNLSLKHGVPVVSGNVSLYNAHKNHSIKPTVVIVMVGVT